MTKVTSTKRPNQVSEPCFLARCLHPFLPWATDGSLVPSKQHLPACLAALPGMPAASCPPPSVSHPAHLHSNGSLPTTSLGAFQAGPRSFHLESEDTLALPFPLLPAKTPRAHLLSTLPGFISFQLKPPVSGSPPSTCCLEHSARPVSSTRGRQLPGSSLWDVLTLEWGWALRGGAVVGGSHGLTIFAQLSFWAQCLAHPRHSTIRDAKKAEWVNEVTVLLKNDSSQPIN